MSDMETEEKRKQLVEELADAPQGTRDAQMPPSPNPFGGEVGPDPADDTLPLMDIGTTPGQGDEEHQTGEEAPGIEDAGSVGAADKDSSTRTEV